MARSGIKAGAPTGPYPALGYLVRKIVDGKATRDIAQIAPISKTSAWELTNGNYVEEETLLHFARAFNVPVNPLRHAMGVPPYPIDPVTGQPWLTLDFLLPLLDPEVGEKIKALATEHGITDAQPDRLMELLNRLLAQGIASDGN